MNQDVERLFEIDLKGFWRTYINFILIKSKGNLTDREIDVLCELMTYRANTPAFPRGRNKELCNTLDMKPPQLSTLKDSLEDKKWLIVEEGALYLRPELRSFQVYVERQIEENGKCEVNFTFPYKIVRDEY